MSQYFPPYRSFGMPYMTCLKKTDFDSKITEVEGKISSISGLATSSALTAVENKIPDVSSLVKKTDFDANIKKIVIGLLQIKKAFAC